MGCIVVVVVVVDLVVLVHRHAITLQTTVEYINIDITNDLMLQIYYRVAKSWKWAFIWPSTDLAHTDQIKDNILGP